MNKPWLSATSLDVFRDCARCFWLDRVGKASRPRGLVPGLPGGLDRILKDHYDAYRPTVFLPPELRGVVTGHLFPDQDLLDRWRDRKSYELNVETPDYVLMAVVDDVIVESMDVQRIAPFDAKSKGDKITSSATMYNQGQINWYGMVFKRNKLSVAPKGYLAYYSPECVTRQCAEFENRNGLISMEFAAQVFSVPVDIDSAEQLLERAMKCLKGPIPPAFDNCEYCNAEKARGSAAARAEKEAAARAQGVMPFGEEKEGFGDQLRRH